MSDKRQEATSTRQRKRKKLVALEGSTAEDVVIPDHETNSNHQPDQLSTSAIQKLKWKKQNDKISQIESSDTSDNDQANTIEYAESDDSPWDPSMSDDNLNTEAECSTVEKLPTKKTVGL
ncbi:hypothetical protein FQA39_LY12375 [Lamprigera yunnana]|nr:hypothetical protein FQA39_LY12375 [Lamprigera yunnana]